MATYANATSIKIGGAITGGGTIGANQYAIVTYEQTNAGIATQVALILNVYYGPGQTILSTLSLGASSYSLLSGVYFANSP